jgi:methionyl-tRNA formyltransferase
MTRFYQQAKAHPQDSALATLAPKLTKDLARIPWRSKSARELINMQRGFSHQVSRSSTLLADLWLRADSAPSQVPLWTTLSRSPGSPIGSDDSTKHLQIRLLDSADSKELSIASSSAEAPGTVALDSHSRQLYVHCATGDKLAVIDKIKSPSGKWVAGRDWWNGAGKSARGGGPTARFE